MKHEYYGWQKLHEAVHSLAGAGTQKERLINALCFSFSLIHIRSDEHLPKEMREDFTNFRAEMTTIDPKNDEGRFEATVNSLDEIGVDRAIEKIIGFYNTACRYSEPL